MKLKLKTMTVPFHEGEYAIEYEVDRADPSVGLMYDNVIWYPSADMPSDVTEDEYERIAEYIGERCSERDDDLRDIERDDKLMREKGI